MSMMSSRLFVGTMLARKSSDTVQTGSAPFDRCLFVQKDDLMNEALAAMEEQLKRWRVKIDELADGIQMQGVHTSFDTLIYIDELKALHAIVQFRLNESTRTIADLNEAWNDLVVAFEKLIK